MFFKIVGVLKNLAKFHKETTVLESLYNKATDLQVCNFVKRDSDTGVFL